MHFIPERLRDGYGLQCAAIDRLHAERVSLIVSVDCGIRSTEAALRARELGVDLIITDHHEPEATLPPAFGNLKATIEVYVYDPVNLVLNPSTLHVLVGGTAMIRASFSPALDAVTAEELASAPRLDREKFRAVAKAVKTRVDELLS